MTKNYYKITLSILTILLLIVTFYRAVFFADYVWDDLYLFLSSDLLRNPESLIDSVSQPVLPGSSYFRPLVFFSFILEFSIFEAKPLVSHSFNLALHLINTFLVFCIGRVYLRRIRALVAVVIYAFHPALIEPVSWVSGRFDLLLTTFSLLSILVAIKGKGFLRIVFCSIFFFLAALSKETAAVIPAIIFIALWVERSEMSLKDYTLYSWRKDLILYLSLFSTGILYLVIRGVYLDNFFVTDLVIDQKFDSVFSHIGFVGNTIGFYIKTTLWPFSDLGPMQPVDVSKYTVEDIIKGGLWVMLATFLLFLSFRRKKDALLVVCFMLALLPVLNIIPLTIGGNIGHERFLTLPLCFIAIFFASLRLPSQLKLSESMRSLLRYIKPIFLALWVVVSGFNIQATSVLWSNQLSFWTWNYSSHPQVPFVIVNYLTALVTVGELDRAWDVYNKSQPTFEKLDYNANHKLVFEAQRAFLLIHDKKYLEAKVELNRIIDGISGMPHKQLQKEDYGKVEIRRNTYTREYIYAPMYSALAQANIELGKFAEAIDNLMVMRVYDSDSPVLYFMWAKALIGLEKEKDAISMLKIASKKYKGLNTQLVKENFHEFLDGQCSYKKLSGVECRDYKSRLISYLDS